MNESANVFGGVEGFAPAPGVTPNLEHWFAQIFAQVSRGLPFEVFEEVDKTGNDNVTQELQHLIDTLEDEGGGIIFVPPGTYKIGSITCGNYVNIIGSGEATIWLAAEDGMTFFESDGIGAFELRNFLLDGDRSNRDDVTGISLIGSTNRVKLHNIFFDDVPGTALNIINSFDNHFYTLHFLDCGATGDPVIGLTGSGGGTSNMNFFYATQIQNGFDDQIFLDGNAMHNAFFGGHLEWFSGHARAQTFDGVRCQGFRNGFFGFHVAEADIGFALNGPRNELHKCFVVSSGTRGLEINGATADSNKVFGGSFDGWRVKDLQEPGGTELHGVESTDVCELDFAYGSKVIGGLINTSSTAAEGLAIGGSRRSVIDGLHVISGSGMKGITVGGPGGTPQYVKIINCALEVSGTPANAIDASVAENVHVAHCSVEGATSGDAISVGTDGILENNQGFKNYAEGTHTTDDGGGATTTYTIPHGLDVTPEWAVVNAAQADAAGDFYISSLDGTNINIEYAAAPPSGTNNLTWHWEAGYLTYR